eukprot:GHVQ01040013.1.p1 GENE.GHVQ01040013.1~~GHVQ01040013.1.p1  ORF type:complete len:812 (+),score=140.85 GHVQ01040013.1:1584-4019(+)
MPSPSISSSFSPQTSSASHLPMSIPQGNTQWTNPTHDPPMTSDTVSLNFYRSPATPQSSSPPTQASTPVIPPSSPVPVHSCPPSYLSFPLDGSVPPLLTPPSTRLSAQCPSSLTASHSPLGPSYPAAAYYSSTTSSDASQIHHHSPLPRRQGPSSVAGGGGGLSERDCETSSVSYSSPCIIQHTATASSVPYRPHSFMRSLLSPFVPSSASHPQTHRICPSLSFSPSTTFSSSPIHHTLHPTSTYSHSPTQPTVALPASCPSTSTRCLAPSYLTSIASSSPSSPRRSRPHRSPYHTRPRSLPASASNRTPAPPRSPPAAASTDAECTDSSIGAVCAQSKGTKRDLSGGHGGGGRTQLAFGIDKTPDARCQMTDFSISPPLLPTVSTIHLPAQSELSSNRGLSGSSHSSLTSSSTPLPTDTVTSPPLDALYAHLPVYDKSRDRPLISQDGETGLYRRTATESASVHDSAVPPSVVAEGVDSEQAQKIASLIHSSRNKQRQMRWRLKSERESGSTKKEQGQRGTELSGPVSVVIREDTTSHTNDGKSSGTQSEADTAGIYGDQRPGANSRCDSPHPVTVESSSGGGLHSECTFGLQRLHSGGVVLDPSTERKQWGHRFRRLGVALRLVCEDGDEANSGDTGRSMGLPVTFSRGASSSSTGEKCRSWIRQSRSNVKEVMADDAHCGVDENKSSCSNKSPAERKGEAQTRVRRRNRFSRTGVFHGGSPRTYELIVMCNLLAIVLGLFGLAGGMYMCGVCLGGINSGRLFNGGFCSLQQKVGGPVGICVGVFACVLSFGFIFSATVSRHVESRRWR